MDDERAKGALTLLRTEIQNEIQKLTGVIPGPDGAPGTPMQGPEGMPIQGQPSAETPVLDQADAMLQMGEQEVRNRLVTEAYGTKLPQRRVEEDYQL